MISFERRKVAFGSAEIKVSSLLFTMSLMVGCGGSSETEVQNSVPVFTSPTTVTVDENVPIAITLNASDSDDDTLAYSIQGEGSSSFETDSKTGVVTFMIPSDYEAKSEYQFTAIVDDGKATASQDVTITIRDRHFIDIAKFVAADAKRFDDFGNSAAMDRDYIVIGANDESNATDEAGSVYIFKVGLDGTVEQIDKLQADNTVSDVGFGDAVAIDGDFVAVSAAKEDGSSAEAGRVYIYKIEAGAIVKPRATLYASDQNEGDHFGTSVAIDGDYLVVGAGQADTNGTDAGSAYLFKRDGDDFIQVAKILASNAGVSDFFGMSVAISGTKIVIGAHAEDTTAQGAGSAYLFRIDTTDDSVSQIAILHADDAEKDDHFGSAVAIDADNIVISAPDKDNTATDAGSVYLFHLSDDDNVSLIDRIDADDAKEKDHFGDALDISGDHIIIGARYKDTGAGDAGGTYLYSINTGTPLLVEKREAFDATLNDHYAAAVAISGDYILSTAIYDDTTETNTGSAYLYVKDSN